MQASELELLSKCSLLGPHCQCYSEFLCREQKGGVPQDRRVAVRAGRLQLRVPLWAAFPCREVLPQVRSQIFPRVQLDRLAVRGGLRPGMLRHHVRSNAAPRPRHFSTWTAGGNPCPCCWSSRCVVPKSIYTTLLDLEKAWTSALSFAQDLELEFGQVFQNVAVNTGMQDVWQALAVCFDWAALVKRPIL